MAVEYINKGATVLGQYRYQLSREWRGTHEMTNWRWLHRVGDDWIGEPKPCVFIMLNPSTADADDDDPTIRKCVKFAASWKYEKLVVVNLFAYRATKPAELLKFNGDPVGAYNAHHVREAVKHAGIVVCAWGRHGSYLGQDETMIGWLDGAGIEPMVLKYTSKGQPNHPLYLRDDMRPAPYRLQL